MQNFRELPGFEEALAVAKVAAALSGEGLYRRPHHGAVHDLDDCPLCGQRLRYNLEYTELLCYACDAVADVELFRIS